MPAGEWYHCYSRGVDKRIVFQNKTDYERFLVHAYVANSSASRRVSDIADLHLHAVLANERFDADPIVEIAAYCLMPTHVHFVLHQIKSGGIATFMQRVFTGYTMYFNNKNERTGPLFAGSFKSKHITDDAYLKRVIPYVLLNPIELFERNWKRGVGNIATVGEKLLKYPYSNLPDMNGTIRPESKIPQKVLGDYYDRMPSLRDMLKDAREYYMEANPQV